ncbi:MAG: hypothetical protein U0354_08995 [Candidatus Sericytochromatia bacterium]
MSKSKLLTLIVGVIIVIAVITPSYYNSKKNAEISQAKIQMSKFNNAIESYKEKNFNIDNFVKNAEKNGISFYNLVNKSNTPKEIISNHIDYIKSKDKKDYAGILLYENIPCKDLNKICYRLYYVDKNGDILTDTTNKIIDLIVNN